MYPEYVFSVLHKEEFSRFKAQAITLRLIEQARVLQ